MKNIKLLLAAALIVFVSACNPRTYEKIHYFQDIQQDTVLALDYSEGIVIQPQDQLSIVVSSRSPELSAMFNLPMVTYAAGSELASSLSGASQRILGYSVDKDGCIIFPQIGVIEVAGLNRFQLQDKIREELIQRDLLSDPVVTVEFLNFKVSVIGEVNSPGTFTVQGDKITVLQAISQARDLTIYGVRDGVEVIREQNGRREIYVLDLRSSDIFSSPAYYLQQNDVVYVKQNDVRAGQSTINENYFKSANFWMSLASVGVTITNLLFVILMK